MALFVRPIALIVVLAPRTAAAGAATAEDYADVEGDPPLTLHAVADVYVQHGFDSPGFATYRAFDARTDAPAVSLLRATFAHRPDPIGFRFDFAVGDTADTFLRYDPDATVHPGVARALSYVEQGFVSATLPLGRGIHVDVGKFATPMGLEDNESVTNWNHSWSLLFTLAEPTYHFGARASYALAHGLDVALFWANGWNTNILTGNGMRTVAGAIRWEVAPRLEITAVYMGGPERATRQLADSSLAFRDELDAYAIWSLHRNVALAATVDYGADAHARGSDFWGVGGYARFQLASFLAAAVRCEHLTDADGFASGTPQRLAEATVTLEARARRDRVTLIGRVEYRRDQSDAAVFGSARSPTETQDTLTSSAVLVF